MVITVIVGPAHCRACDKLVVYATVGDKQGTSPAYRAWRDPQTGNVHRCKKEGDIA